MYGEISEKFVEQSMNALEEGKIYEIQKFVGVSKEICLRAGVRSLDGCVYKLHNRR